MPFGYVYVKDFQVKKLLINKDNELEIEVANITFYNKVYVQVFYFLYTDESILDIDGKINLVNIKMVFDDLNRENPKPRVKVKDVIMDLSYSDDFVVKSNNWIFEQGAKLGKKLIQKTIDVMMTKILYENIQMSINNMIDLYLKEKYLINDNYKFILKTVKKPQFGGNEHKRIKLFFETKIKKNKQSAGKYASDNAIKIYFKKPFFESVARHHDLLSEKLYRFIDLGKC